MQRENFKLMQRENFKLMQRGKEKNFQIEFDNKRNNLYTTTEITCHKL